MLVYKFERNIEESPPPQKKKKKKKNESPSNIIYPHAELRKRRININVSILFIQLAFGVVLMYTA